MQLGMLYSVKIVSHIFYLEVFRICPSQKIVMNSKLLACNDTDLLRFWRHLLFKCTLANGAFLDFSPIEFLCNLLKLQSIPISTMVPGKLLIFSHTAFYC